MVDMEPRSYYDENAERERERLAETLPKRMEFENTVKTLEEVFPEDATVLDAGGGPGHYSVWLAERGATVEHVDLSSELVEVAREQAADAGVADAVTAREGDLRELPFEAGAFDAVCCLGGALNHVVDDAERERAVAELHRVAKPNAPVVVSVISRVGGARYTLKDLAIDDEHDPARSALLEHYVRTGDFTEDVVERYDAEEGWAAHHSFRVDELETLLEEGGLATERVVALEGITTNLHDELEGVPEHVAEVARTLATELREDRALADLSEHFLVVARSPQPSR